MHPRAVSSHAPAVGRVCRAAHTRPPGGTPTGDAAQPRRRGRPDHRRRACRHLRERVDRVGPRVPRRPGRRSPRCVLHPPRRPLQSACGPDGLDPGPRCRPPARGGPRRPCGWDGPLGRGDGGEPPGRPGDRRTGAQHQRHHRAPRHHPPARGGTCAARCHRRPLERSGDVLRTGRHDHLGEPCGEASVRHRPGRADRRERHGADPSTRPGTRHRGVRHDHRGGRSRPHRVPHPRRRG